jgi:hypothetical protein
VWYQYWLRVGLSLKRELLWFSYVLLIGVAGGFIALITSLSVMVYESLVWFFGETVSDIATQHFNDSVNALGTAVIGLGVWWYHGNLLKSTTENSSIAESAAGARSEIRRVYEYIVSGISLIAAAAGLMMILVAIIESVTPGEVVSTTSSTNTLLLAITLILVHLCGGSSGSASKVMLQSMDLSRVHQPVAYSFLCSSALPLLQP